MKLRILFIIRNYPPKVEGLEEYNYNLIREFESREITYEIALLKSKKHLLWFFSYSFFKARHAQQKHFIHHIHLNNLYHQSLAIMKGIPRKALIQ